MHRCLGVAGGLLFIAWFISGIAMMYVRMPTATPDERAFYAEPLREGLVRIAPDEAARRAGLPTALGVELAMLLGRPVYRFPGRPPRVIFADDGSDLGIVTADDAVRVVREWTPASASMVHYRRTLTRPDQWTLEYQEHLPIHEIEVEDDAGTRFYVSGRTGVVVVRATRAGRFWGYVGPVMHWLYVPVLRRNGPLWTKVILWASGIGCITCLVGLIVGLARFSPAARFGARRGGTRSPYRGLMRWHHYAGLLFGVITLSWTFSGLMSMGPFDWLSSRQPPTDLSKTVAGRPAYGRISVPNVQRAVSAIGHDFAPKLLELTAFRGEPYWMSDEAPTRLVVRRRTRTQDAPRAHRLVAALQPEQGAFARFGDSAIEQVARDAMPGVAVTDATWLASYDDYYLHRTGESPLPVLRVRYADANSTWIYFDPQHGSAALILRSRERLDRWLYQGLHSLSWPGLYFRRPLWDIVTIALLLGGLTLATASLAPGWSRVARRTRGLFRRPVSSLKRETL